MEVVVKHNNNSYRINQSSGKSLSIPYNYNGDQPSFYDAEKGSAIPMKQNGFIGLVNDESGCNVMNINQNIHCTGTHTECAGHILPDSISINDVLSHEYYLTELISISSISALETNETYHVPFSKEDKIITKRMIEGKIPDKALGLIIRTLPNSLSKMNQRYNATNTIFFTKEAIKYITDCKIRHLVVDMPTIDKYDDGGHLGNHHLFFENNPPYKKTITEMAYIDNEIIDGSYLMTIEIPPMVLDAAPSRPFIFDIKD